MGKYIGFGCEHGHDIPEDEALDYALERCGVSIDHKAPDAMEFDRWLTDNSKAFVEWFYSGNWFYVD